MRPKYIALSICIMMVLITPLINVQTFAFGVFTSKQLWLYFLTLLTVPVLLVCLIKQRLYWTSLDLTISVFLLYLFFNSIVTGFDIYGNKKTLFFCCDIVVYFCIRYYLGNLQVVERLRRTVLLCCGVFLVSITVCCYGILQKIGLISSLAINNLVPGTFFHPAPFAGFISAIFPLSATTFFVSKDKINHEKYWVALKWLSIINCCLIILILPSTGSRAAFIGLLCGIAYSYFFLSKIQVSNVIRSFAGKIKIVGIITAAVILLIALYNFRSESVKGRLLVWKISSQAISSKPFFGWGTNSFKKVYPDYQIKYFASGKSDINEQLLSYEVNSGFSEIVQVTFEWGICGLALFSLLFYNAFKRSKINSLLECDLLAGMRGALFSYGIFSLFSYPFSLPEMSLYFFVFLAMQTSFIEITTVQNKYVGQTVVFFLVTVIIFIMSNVVIMSKLFYAYQQWQQALIKTNLGDNRSANIIYKQIYPELKRDEFFLSNYSYSCYSQGDYNSCIKVLMAEETPRYDDLILLGECFKKTGRFNISVGYYKKAYFLLPHKFYPVYQMMKISAITKDSLQMIALAKLIVQKKIKIESPEVNTMIMEANRILRSVHGNQQITRSITKEAITH